jgi:hypothetical protein
MLGIDRPTIQANVSQEPALLQLLLVAIVMCVAKSLNITEPEQAIIATMRDDVINHGRRVRFALSRAHHAKRMLAKILPRPSPPTRAALGAIQLAFCHLHG